MIEASYHKKKWASVISTDLYKNIA